ncbi:hypothetical protein bcgnr5386_52520 [Bacillus cereus]
MMGFIPFHECWKRDAYVSWTAYLIGMSLITIVSGELFNKKSAPYTFITKVTNSHCLER